MTDITDMSSTAATALALVRSKQRSEPAVRQALTELRRSGQGTSDLTIGLLDALRISRAEINGTLSKCSDEISKGIERNIFPIPISSDTYPFSLRLIEDAPPVIFIRGSQSCLLKLPGVAIVGTRKATPHGVTIANRLAAHISTKGFAVVSGLALGIDAAAHAGALTTETPTVAVLAHGLEKASPRANAKLADRILDQGGAWISEHPFGTPARPEYFVFRNRIQVGLSCASIIVEGEVRSGSATQAEFCIQNRRQLFAVVPDPRAPVITNSALPVELVRRGTALPIASRDDYAEMISIIEKQARLLRERGTSAF